MITMVLFSSLLRNLETEVNHGILYYTKKDDMSGLSIDRNEVRGLIQRRNEIASYIQHGSLPPLIKDPRLCSKCPQLGTCTLYHKVRWFCW